MMMRDVGRCFGVGKVLVKRKLYVFNPIGAGGYHVGFVLVRHWFRFLTFGDAVFRRYVLRFIAHEVVPLSGCTAEDCGWKESGVLQIVECWGCGGVDQMEVYVGGGGKVGVSV